MAKALARQSRQEVADMVAAGAAKAGEGDFRGAVELMGEAVTRLPDNPQVVFNAAVAVLKCLEHEGWDERMGQQALTFIAGVRRLDPRLAPKLRCCRACISSCCVNISPLATPGCIRLTPGKTRKNAG